MTAMNFNNNDVPLTAVPDGEYIVEIVDSELKPNKAGNGINFFLKYKTIEGQYIGAIIQDSCIFSHSNMMAENIGKRRIRLINEAIGLSVITDTAQYLGKVLKIRVEVEKVDGNAFLKVKDYEGVNGPAQQNVAAPPGGASNAELGTDDTGEVPAWA